MNHPLILGHLTVLDQSPPHAIHIAREVGFRKVGLRLQASRPDATGYELQSNPSLFAETVRALQETGVEVFDVDVCKLGPTTDVKTFEPFLATAAKLGARSALVTCGDSERKRFEDKLGSYCDIAKGYGITADLEFMLFTPIVPTLAVALDVIASVSRDNLGVMVDTIHFDRTGEGVDDLHTVPRKRLNYIHFTDARRERPQNIEGLVEDSRAFRMLPGDGGLDLVSIIQALPDGLPLCVEVSNAQLDRSTPALERARLAFQKTQAVLEAAKRKGN
jgi:sugar phosphate isomerase/epimerase